MTQVIEDRSYGIDEASYQSESIASYPDAKFAIVKTTEGLSYQNPKARNQTITAKQAGIAIGGYHYGHFSGNATQAIQEGNFAVQVAKNVGIPLGSLFAADWETGSGNITNGNKEDNTNAILAFMDVVAKAGYKPFLYTGKSLLENDIDTKRITDKYGDCLWVAYYKVEGRQDTADFNSYNGSCSYLAIYR